MITENKGMRGRWTPAYENIIAAPANMAVVLDVANRVEAHRATNALLARARSHGETFIARRHGNKIFIHHVKG